MTNFILYVWKHTSYMCNNFCFTDTITFILWQLVFNLMTMIIYFFFPLLTCVPSFVFCDNLCILWILFVTTYVYYKFYLWQFMFIIIFAFFGNFVIIWTYKYFFVTTFILYVWQLISYMCGNSFNNIILKFSHKLLLVENVYKIYATEI